MNNMKNAFWVLITSGLLVGCTREQGGAGNTSQQQEGRGGQTNRWHGIETNEFTKQGHAPGTRGAPIGAGTGSAGGTDTSSSNAQKRVP